MQEQQLFPLSSRLGETPDPVSAAFSDLCIALDQYGEGSLPVLTARHLLLDQQINQNGSPLFLSAMESSRKDINSQIEALQNQQHQ
jgi:hypothetical protein